jgi:predicted DNA-binding protein (UPF0251 family)
MDTTTDVIYALCSFGGIAGLLEKREFVERLQELRDKARDIQNGTVLPPKVVAAPTPNVPSAKDVMPIDANLTDDEIEAMSLADVKEILKFHGAEHSSCWPSVATFWHSVSRVCSLIADAISYSFTRHRWVQRVCGKDRIR